MALRWPFQAVIVSGGAVDAIRQSQHPVVDRLMFDRLDATHGRRFRITVPSEDAMALKLLLVSIGAGEYPHVDAYGRKACRKAVTILGGEPIRRYKR